MFCFEEIFQLHSQLWYNSFTEYTHSEKRRYINIKCMIYFRQKFNISIVAKTILNKTYNGIYLDFTPSIVHHWYLWTLQHAHI